MTPEEEQLAWENAISEGWPNHEHHSEKEVMQRVWLVQKQSNYGHWYPHGVALFREEEAISAWEALKRSYHNPCRYICLPAKGFYRLVSFELPLKVLDTFTV